LRWVQDGTSGPEGRAGATISAKWGLDNIEVELGAVDRPAVILTASEDIGEGQDLGLLSVMAQISEPIIAFDRLRIKAEGGTIASVNKLTGIGAGKGEMYTIAIVPDTGAGEVTVQILEGAGMTKKGLRSMASNSIAIMVPMAIDPKLSMIQRVSAAPIDLDATGMPEQEITGRTEAVGGLQQGLQQTLQEFQTRLEYLEREVVRLQQLEAEFKYLKSSLLRSM